MSSNTISFYKRSYTQGNGSKKQFSGTSTRADIKSHKLRLDFFYFFLDFSLLTLYNTSQRRTLYDSPDKVKSIKKCWREWKYMGKASKVNKCNVLLKNTASGHEGEGRFKVLFYESLFILNTKHCNYHLDTMSCIT